MKPLWTCAAIALLGLAAQARAASLVALLVEPEKNAAQGRAVVQIVLKGAPLQDPGKSAGTHLHIQLDKETPIATADMRVSFHGLAPGPHTIAIVLVDEDDKPLGAADSVWLTVPAPPER